LLIPLKVVSDSDFIPVAGSEVKPVVSERSGVFMMLELAEISQIEFGSASGAKPLSFFPKAE
jgi:hypothetical protein